MLSQNSRSKEGEAPGVITTQVDHAGIALKPLYKRSDIRSSPRNHFQRAADGSMVLVEPGSVVAITAEEPTTT